MARFYSNENFPLPVVDELRKLGHDVLTIQETGKASQRMSDDEVLDFATRDNRTILTMNRRHFVKRHLGGTRHSGIVVRTFDTNYARQAHSIDTSVQRVPSLACQLIRVNRPNSS
jgi:predicted nuclease of predicted toxin-antitoxin system